QRSQLAQLSVVELVGFKSIDGAVRGLSDEQHVQHPDHLAVDQGPQFSGHLAREVHPMGWEFDHRIIDGAELVHVFVTHRVDLLSVVDVMPRSVIRSLLCSAVWGGDRDILAVTAGYAISETRA